MTRTTICRTTCSSSVAPSPPPRLLTTRSNGCETCCATTDVLLIEGTGYTGNAHKQPCPHIHQLAQIILANPDHKSHISASTNMLNSYTFPSVFFLLSHLRLPFFSPLIETQPRPRLHLPAAFSQADTCSTRQAVACTALAPTSYLSSTCDLSNFESRPAWRDQRLIGQPVACFASLSNLERMASSRANAVQKSARTCCLSLTSQL